MKQEATGLSFYLLFDCARGVRGVAHVAPEFRGDIHKHAEPETYVLLKGQGVLHLDGKERELRAGDSVRIESNVPHAFVSTRGTAILMFEFKTGPLGTIEYSYTGEVMRPPPSSPPSPPPS